MKAALFALRLNELLGVVVRRRTLHGVFQLTEAASQGGIEKSDSLQPEIKVKLKRIIDTSEFFFGNLWRQVIDINPFTYRVTHINSLTFEGRRLTPVAPNDSV